MQANQNLHWAHMSEDTFPNVVALMVSVHASRDLPYKELLPYVEKSPISLGMEIC